MIVGTKTELSLASGILQELLERDYAKAAVLRRRADGAVFRLLPRQSATTVIAKFWVRPGIRGLARRMTGTASGKRELKALELLRGAGVSVPEPLGYQRLSPEYSPYTEVIFLEDLGEAEPADQYLSRLLNEQPHRAEELEEQILQMTRDVIGAGIVDQDHGLHNIIVLPGEEARIARIDLETARCFSGAHPPPKVFGVMLGRLLSSYIFAVQPRVERLKRFSTRLSELLEPSARIRQQAEEFVRYKLAAQKRRTGIDTRIQAVW